MPDGRPRRVYIARMPRLRTIGLVLALLTVSVAGALPGGPATAGTASTQIESDRQYPASLPGVYFDGVGPGKNFRPGPDQVGFAGRLTAIGAPLPDQTLALERRPAGSDTWTAIATHLTGDDGWTTFYTPVAGNADYRITYAGDETYPAATGETMPLVAMRDFNAVMVKRQGTPFLRGDINPGWGRKVVAWQRRTCGTCAWRTVMTRKAGRDGSWEFRAAFPPTGKKWFFRAKLASTASFMTSTSAVLRTRTLPGRPGTGHRARIL